LKVTYAARDELLEIWSFIAQDNLTAADNLLAAFADQFDRLLRFPEVGRDRRELKIHLLSVPVRNYIIFYQLTDRYVEILRVLQAPGTSGGFSPNRDTFNEEFASPQSPGLIIPLLLSERRDPGALLSRASHRGFDRSYDPPRAASRSVLLRC
jgi:toxin ParE1/3/4